MEIKIDPIPEGMVLVGWMIRTGPSGMAQTHSINLTPQTEEDLPLYVPDNGIVRGMRPGEEQWFMDNWTEPPSTKCKHCGMEIHLSDGTWIHTKFKTGSACVNRIVGRQVVQTKAEPDNVA